FSASLCCLYVDRRHLHSFPTRRSSDLPVELAHALVADAGDDLGGGVQPGHPPLGGAQVVALDDVADHELVQRPGLLDEVLDGLLDRKSTRLNSSHVKISYAVFCLKKKK